MEVNESVLQSGMTEQDLNGAQVGAGLEKVGSTAVAAMSLKT
jgi:hypothetical protein